MQAMHVIEQSALNPDLSWTVEKKGAKTRLNSSAACRYWYKRRQQRQKNQVVLLAPPWPVLRLACRLQDKSLIVAFLAFLLGLIAVSGGDELPSSHKRSNFYD